MWCLPTHLADKFLDMIAKGDITPDQMMAMTSAERRAFFGEHFGKENAQRLNAQLESKLLLKNQQKGMVTWAKKVAGLTEPARRDLAARVNRMEEVLTPETEDAFLEDLAAQALGVSVTMKEAGNITSLAKEVNERKTTMEAGARRGLNESPTATELDYGRSLVAFDNYVTSLKLAAEKNTVSDLVERYKDNPFSMLSDSLSRVAAESREIRSSLDNSYIGRQGRNLFFKGMTGDFVAGKAWLDTFRRSHRILWETFKGKGVQVMDEIRAEIISDPEYEMIRKARVATSVVEEEAPSDWFKHVPYLGLPFYASHNAFTGSAHLLRYRTAKYYFNIARKTGVDLTETEQLECIGRLVNALTGRGEFGKGASQKPGILNNVFFSPRLLKADVDTLTAHVFDRGATKFIRKEAAKNLMRIIVAQALILAVADLIDDDAVEWDPRSSDAFKIKVGNTRFNVGAGVGILIRVAARLAPLIINKDAYYKTAKGELKKMNEGAWKRTGLDVFEDFIESKSAPAMSVFLAHLRGTYLFKDEKPSLVGDVRELATPFPIETGKELLDDEESANFLISMMLEAYGVSVQTYDSGSGRGPVPKEWTN